MTADFTRAHYSISLVKMKSGFISKLLNGAGDGRCRRFAFADMCVCRCRVVPALILFAAVAGSNEQGTEQVRQTSPLSPNGTL